MAKSKTAYVCQNCGYESAKWYGKCPECGQWNTMEEQLKSPAPMGGKAAQAAPVVTNLEVSTMPSPRRRRTGSIPTFPSWIGFWAAALSRGL